MFGIFKRARRKNILKQPFSEEWLAVLEKNVPLYLKLPPHLQAELRSHIKIFIAEKHFEGCQGLEMTDEIKVTVSAQACCLLLNRKVDYYPALKTILVYPTTFILPSKAYVGAGVLEEADKPVLGLCFKRDVVILAWDSVLHGASHLHDGKNVVFHEFAHQLDVQEGHFNGAPVLATRAHYMTWAKVMSNRFEKLSQKRRSGKKSFLNQYGATNPAEFFAVATEYFFEQPGEMKNKHPDLFNELKSFYNQNPLTYI